MSTHTNALRDPEDIRNTLKRYLHYLKQDDQNLSLLLSISSCYRQLGEFSEAQKYLDTAKQLSSQEFCTEQGMIYLQANQLPQAFEQFSRAWETEKNPLTTHNLVLSLYLNKDWAQALDRVQELDVDSKTPQSFLLQARILHHLQRFEEAVQLLETQSFAEQDEEADRLGLCALIYLDNNQVAKSKIFCEHALQLNTHNREGNIVHILLKTLENTVEVEEIEAVIQKNPKESRLWFALGSTLMRNMNMNAAAQAFKQATQLWPGFFNAWISLGWCHLLGNHLEQAWDDFQQALMSDKEAADGWGGLALVSALRNDYSEAKHCSQIASRIDPHCFPLILTELILANEDNPQQSLKHLTKAFPESSNEIQNVLSKAILQLYSDNRVLH